MDKYNNNKFIFVFKSRSLIQLHCVVVNLCFDIFMASFLYSDVTYNKIIIFFIFIFTKGIDVLTRTNSYETPYSGPDTTTEERIKKFVK